METAMNYLPFFLRDKTTLQRLLGMQVFSLSRQAVVPRASSRIPPLTCGRNALHGPGEAT